MAIIARVAFPTRPLNTTGAGEGVASVVEPVKGPRRGVVRYVISCAGPSVADTAQLAALFAPIAQRVPQRGVRALSRPVIIEVPIKGVYGPVIGVVKNATAVVVTTTLLGRSVVAVAWRLCLGEKEGNALPYVRAVIKARDCDGKAGNVGVVIT